MGTGASTAHRSVCLGFAMFPDHGADHVRTDFIAQ